MLYTSLLAHTLPELFSRFLCPQRPPESQQTPCGGGLVTRSCLTLVTPWTLTCQVPLPMGFSRQEYWSGLPFPAPGDLPNPGIEPGSPALQAYSLPTELWEKSVKPLVVQLNWSDFVYKTSAWGQDSTPSPIFPSTGWPLWVQMPGESRIISLLQSGLFQRSPTIP